MTLDYSVGPDTVDAKRALTNSSSPANIIFRAKNIRQERTGVHATIIIGQDTAILAQDVFNVERDPERVRLANSAYQGVSRFLRESYHKDDLKHDLDMFCVGLWERFIASVIPEPLIPNDPNPISCLLQPHIIEGGGSILFAPPGVGKSFTGLLMTASIHHGVNTLWPVKQVPVIFVNLERSASSISRRLLCINNALGLAPDTPLPIINRRGNSLAGIEALLLGTIERYKARFVCVDSISRAGVGDLTENAPINKIIDLLNNSCESWLALAHTPRQDASHIYGGIHFDAGADVTVKLTSQVKGTTIGIGLQNTKANDLPKTPMGIFAYEFDQFGLSVARKAEPREFVAVEAGAQKDIVQEIEEALLDIEPMTATQLADMLGRSRAYISTILNKDGRFFSTRVGKEVKYDIKRESS